MLACDEVGAGNWKVEVIGCSGNDEIFEAANGVDRVVVGNDGKGGNAGFDNGCDVTAGESVRVIGNETD